MHCIAATSSICRGADHAPGIAVGDVVADGAALCFVGDAHHAVCQVAALQVIPAQTCHLSHFSAVPKRLHKLRSLQVYRRWARACQTLGAQPQGGWLRRRAAGLQAGEHRCAAHALCHAMRQPARMVCASVLGAPCRPSAGLKHGRTLV